jgi:hypothetical protein
MPAMDVSDADLRSELGAGPGAAATLRPGAKVALLSRIVGGNDNALRRLRDAGVDGARPAGL